MRIYRRLGDLEIDGPEFDEPERPLQAGDVLIVRRSFSTPVELYEEGNFLIVMGRTDEVPYDRRASTGNLKVLGKDGRTTIWSNIEWGMAEGELELL